MMKSILLALMLFALPAANSLADPLPFDMSTENADPRVQSSPAAPLAARPETSEEQSRQLGEVLTPDAPAKSSAPALAAPDASSPVSSASEPSATMTGLASPGQINRRYLIPANQLTLNGEIDQKDWSLFLTSWQATNAESLSLSYRNTVVIAPESSRMIVSINDHVVIEEPLRSPASFTKLTVPLPEGLLRYGANTISVRVAQRHRTDCTIDSTYELVTTLNAQGSYLTLPASERISDLEAIRAIGVDGNGDTHFEISSPSIKQSTAVEDLLSLGQGLALLAGMPNQDFAFNRDALPVSGPGRLGVLVGTASELAPIVPNLPQAARVGQLASMLRVTPDSAPILVISGPDWASISSAIGKIVAPLSEASVDQRAGLQNSGWTGPDLPVILSDSQFSLSDLGLKTQEFSGRRFQTTFSIMLPGDFYGRASSEFTILLDAAYAPDVLPGNHITVFVNGEVASVVQINNRHGGIFKHFPVSVTMRHFKPGRNTITLSAELSTNQDAVCAPGENNTREPRFALFNTTEIQIEKFARAGQFPNLAATARTGFPYTKDEKSISLFLEPVGPETMSSAATVLGKMALSSGHALGVKPKTSLRAIGEEDTIFVAPISQIPRSFLDRFHIAPDASETWNQIAVTGTEEADTTKQFSEWQDRISSEGLLGYLERAGSWLHDRFGLTTDELELFKDIKESFMPTPSDILLLAQNTSFEGKGNWTLITGPTVQNLALGNALIASQSRWENLQGYLTALTPDRMVSRLDPNPTLHLSDPWDIRNLRLVITDWLSHNSLVYVGLLILAAIFLALSWGALLKRSGRRE
ncbi:cellulose biosynthesis cyclic di-GMP-binding regulatory protein BcsB [Cohaesibacter marisflavi]|nr:cellulose biosynthesis cyclic di-GMP-binding regulatory protein BcsB [Cohaesibacter marisflavi]